VLIVAIRQHSINIGSIGFGRQGLMNFIKLFINLIKLFAKKLHQFAVVNGIIILIV